MPQSVSDPATSPAPPPVLGLRDQRLIAALQCDGRLSAERAAEVLGENPRTVHRRWQALIGDGTVKVIAQPVRPASVGALLLRIKVLKGKLDALTAALAARPDIPFIDLSASGDEISAVSYTEPGSRDHLVFRQLPATPAVASVSAATVLHVFSEASDWRHNVLTPTERAALTPTRRPSESVRPAASGPGPASGLDPIDADILAALSDDARTPAAVIAARTGHPASTVRRRLARLMADGRLSTQVAVDPRRLGLFIDANVMLQVPPDHLDTVGRTLARHPAVHGAFATSGTANLHAAVWLPDLTALYRLITEDLTGLGIAGVETVIVGHAVKRPGR
ncbi:AsnC family transcriptional regulator [Streptomyces chrestomyceticus JCM 4735]|uniref:AsnC family transcriptional regulator n=1 Tax=Streptomyces chrestomyceticus JCM 4735 TaxID=1306181 RepID=A0A7U9L0W4_9ACTN|nr:AsnC family transcriptional regulator [Streptomyces chrestomyceticus]GCD38989.1 AsnC family transcriptional regulator [Streptomyces chrestomyceticus JCM 4735]